MDEMVGRNIELNVLVKKILNWMWILFFGFLTCEVITAVIGQLQDS